MADHSTGPLGEYRPGYDPDHADRLAKLGIAEEGIAWFFEVPVYTIYVWDRLYPEFAGALTRGRMDAVLAERKRPRARTRYPAYTWALQFCRRTRQPELAALLTTKMQAMQAIGPQAAAGFDAALREDIMTIQPLRRIPRRA